MYKLMKRTRSLAISVALTLLAFAAAGLAFAPAPLKANPANQVAAAATPLSMASPDDVFVAIRNKFRTHRPPPPFEIYTLVRSQQTSYGYPDYNDSYTYHIWYRSNDHAAMERKHFHLGAIGNLEFKRPMFNIADDPGPPTADVFEPAPLHTLAPDFVPTPEGSTPPVIATVRVRAVYDYRVTNIQHEGDQLHVSVLPKRDVERNRLRELWVDAKTLELKKIIVTDKLFIEHGPVYPIHFTITFNMLDGFPVITHIHGEVDDPGYDGDGKTVEYEFNDIAFPKTLPDWYFNARDYAQHNSDAPDTDG